jgi:hypothetical protein
MSASRFIGRFVKVGLLIPIVLVLTAEVAGASSVAVVGGGASGETVSLTSILGTTVVSGPAPSVTLPPTGGGPFTQSVATVNVPGLLTAGVLTVSTQGVFGPSGFVDSSASVADANLAGGAVTATVIGSQCHIDAVGNTTGSTTLVGASVLGASLPANPSPNSAVTVAGVGTLTLNEQTSTVGPGGNRSITVTAVHLHLTGPVKGDIVLAQSVCRARI